MRVISGATGTEGTCADAVRFVYIGSACHKPDTNCNSCIEMPELTAFIDRWKISNQDVTLRELIEAIGLWKKGC